MLDVAANQGWLVTSLNITSLIQMLIQGQWKHESTLLTIPNVEHHHLYLFRYIISCYVENVDSHVQLEY